MVEMADVPPSHSPLDTGASRAACLQTPQPPPPLVSWEYTQGLARRGGNGRPRLWSIPTPVDYPLEGSHTASSVCKAKGHIP